MFLSHPLLPPPCTLGLLILHLLLLRLLRRLVHSVDEQVVTEDQDDEGHRKDADEDIGCHGCKPIGFGGSVLE